MNLGPVSPVLTDVTPNPDPSGLGFNPRCLRRDISTIAAGFSQDSEIVSLLTNSADFLSFNTRIQGDFPNLIAGVHTGGHFTVGGDPGGDFFASTADPFFFLHHAMIDRTYWTWQNLDLATRQFAVAGPIALGATTGETTLDDIISLGTVLGVPDITIRDASSTIGGPFCYVYE